MKLRSALALCTLVLSLLALATPALADHHGAAAGQEAAPGHGHGPGHGEGRPEPSAEDRASMADAHQRMAECLRSDRPFKECRSEMKKAHAAWGHGQGCDRGKACDHGKGCPHGKDCPHGDACPHGASCDGSCQHHGGKDGHGAMCEDGKGKGKPGQAGEPAAEAVEESKPPKAR